ncbi:MAG TPA: GNAT family N-acetyltransferase [Dehalococcoidia bacterium]|nr:GNAT family N-acetyltransferase [Dehalococcoidia bacterium]
MAASGMTIEPARPEDAAAVAACVNAAYARYLPRMGSKPAPMLADYPAEIAAGRVHVLRDGDALVGLIVLIAEPDHLFIENVAIDPAAQGRGLGRRLLDFAESEARRLGLPELRLYTNELMTENLGLYAHLGYLEVDRRLDEGYRRVFMVKRLGASRTA